MSETLENWLEQRRQRRHEAVDRAYGVLGLDYGHGHLDDLYWAAYEDGLRDAYAMVTQQAGDWFQSAHGRHDVLAVND